MEKEFELSLVLGRFNHLHNGHKMIIDMSRKISKNTLILIGSSEKSGTYRNPFSLKTRKDIIEKIYGNENDIIISELKDMTDEADASYEWGYYLLENVVRICGRRPDLMIYGKDESRKGWFAENTIKDITELVFSRDKIKISATMLREYLAKGQYDTWCQFVPKEIQSDYDKLRKELLKVKGYEQNSYNSRLIYLPSLNLCIL